MILKLGVQLEGNQQPCITRFRLKLRFAVLRALLLPVVHVVPDSPRMTCQPHEVVISFIKCRFDCQTIQQTKLNVAGGCLTAGNNSGIPPTLLLPRPVMMTLHQVPFLNMTKLQVHPSNFAPGPKHVSHKNYVSAQVAGVLHLLPLRQQQQSKNQDLKNKVSRGLGQDAEKLFEFHLSSWPKSCKSRTFPRQSKSQQTCWNDCCHPTLCPPAFHSCMLPAWWQWMSCLKLPEKTPC